MKKVLLLICGLCLCSSAFAQAEEDSTEVELRIVDSLPHNRKVVLEQYTGINSPFCPAAHKAAVTYAAQHPDSVFIINIHTGGYAPKYRTAWGDTIANHAGFAPPYPSASINRTIFDNDKTAVGDTNLWKTYGNQILNLPSFVNVAAKAEFDYFTKEISIHIETFYTNTAETDANSVYIMLMQDNVYGKQKGMENNAAQIVDEKYKHKFMFRDFLYSKSIQVTDTTGGKHLIAPVDSGTFFAWDTSFYLPDSTGINGDKLATELGNMYFIVFVAQDSGNNIYTATKIYPTFTNLPAQITFNNEGINAEMVLGCNDKVIPSITIKNISDSIIHSLQMNCMGVPTKYWTGTLLSFENLTLTFDTLEVEIGTASSLVFSIDTVNGNVLETGSPYFTAMAAFTKPDLLQGKGTPVLLLQCDRWGSEITWKLYNATTRQVIQSGGPYPDYSIPPTKPDTIVLNSVNAAGCYIFEINDSYWDGINTINGAGFYKIIDGEKNILVSSNGKFGEGEKKDFYIESMVGLENIADSTYQYTLSPNPAKNKTTLSITVPEAITAQITITNMLGYEVANIGTKTLKVGNNSIEINTAAMNNGIYFVNVISEKGTSTKKLAIKK